MAKIRSIDLALLFTLGPLWLFSTVVSLDRSFSDHPPAWFPVYVGLDMGSAHLPEVRGFLPAALSGDIPTEARRKSMARDVRMASQAFQPPYVTFDGESEKGHVTWRAYVSLACPAQPGGTEW